MTIDIETLVVRMYASLKNHRAVQRRLAEMGHRLDLHLIMLWVGLISPEMWVRVRGN